MKALLPEAMRMTISGSARVATHDSGSGAQAKEPKVDEFRFSGTAVYNPARKAFEKFDLVAFSETGHYDEIARKVLPLGVALELTSSDAPMDRLPPAFYSPTYFR